MFGETIAAISTPTGQGGIGIIRLSGDDSIAICERLFVSANQRRLADSKSHTLSYGTIKEPLSGQIIDEVLVAVMRAPSTYTRENVVEINCHGGMIVLKKILAIVLKEGARLAEPGEFTKRAFLNGRIDLTQAESVMDVIQAESEMALSSSVKQLSGQLKEQINQIKQQIIEIMAYLEAGIDYPEYDFEEISSDNMRIKLEMIRQEINRLLKSYDNGKVIREGIRTAIIGKPNVGKSSILNVLLKENRAIVTDIPGTTRDTLEERLQINGIPLNIIDTAGIRQTEDQVEKIGVDRSKKMINEADLVILVFDGAKQLSIEDYQIMKLVEDKKVIVLINKMDLAPVINKQQLIKQFNRVIDISALKGQGIEAIEQAVYDLFIDGKIEPDKHLYVTNLRHKEALVEATEHIHQVFLSIDNDMPEDCWSIDLKNVYQALGKITGDVTADDLMNQIFSQFCLGK